MNYELEQMLWSAGQSDRAYDREIWYKIVDSLLDDFQKFIGQIFDRDSESDLYLKIEEPLSPAFTSWI